jgi:hypothetical protein
MVEAIHSAIQSRPEIHSDGSILPGGIAATSCPLFQRNSKADAALMTYARRGSWRNVMPFLFWFPYIILSGLIDIAAEPKPVRVENKPLRRTREPRAD